MALLDHGRTWLLTCRHLHSWPGSRHWGSSGQVDRLAASKQPCVLTQLFATGRTGRLHLNGHRGDMQWERSDHSNVSALLRHHWQCTARDGHGSAHHCADTAETAVTLLLGLLAIVSPEQPKALVGQHWLLASAIAVPAGWKHACLALIMRLQQQAACCLPPSCYTIGN